MREGGDRHIFSAVIPTLRRPDELRNVLTSVFQCQPQPDEAVIVDGDIDERSAEAVSKEFTDAFPVVYVPSPPGLPRQRNAGLKAVRGTITCFFDDDVVLDPALFAHLEGVFAQPDVVGATGRVVEEETRRFFGKHSAWRRLLPGGGREGSFTRYGYPHRLIHLEQARDIEFMHGSFMCVRTDIARTLLFDEVLEGYALGEDEDFSYRLSRRGRIRYEPRAVVHHSKKGFGTSDQREFGRRVVENRAYLFRKNFPQTVRARIQFQMFIAGLVLHRLVNREWEGARGLIEGWFAVNRRPRVGRRWFRRSRA